MANKEYHREYYRKNAERLRNMEIKRRMENREEFKKRDKEYHDRISFGGNKQRILERDKYSCVKCGLAEEEHLKRWNYRITVDHIDGNRKNNSLDNLQTLCLSCHGTKDNLRAYRDGLREPSNQFLVLFKRKVKQ